MEKEAVRPLVQIPTLAGKRSDESPVLLVDPKDAAKMAALILEKDQERKEEKPTS